MNLTQLIGVKKMKVETLKEDMGSETKTKTELLEQTHDRTNTNTFFSLDLQILLWQNLVSV